MNKLEQIKAALPADLKQIERQHGSRYAAQVAAPHINEFLASNGITPPAIDNYAKQKKLLKAYAMGHDAHKDNFVMEAISIIQGINSILPAVQPQPTPPPPPPAPDYTPLIIGGAAVIALILIFK